MKSVLLFLFFCFSSLIALAQVGINTENPLATLDVNGDLRVRDVPSDTLSQNVLLLSADSIVTTNTVKDLISKGSNLKSFVKATVGSPNPIVDSTIIDDWYKISMPIKELDENGIDYDTITSEFTAPVDGIYNIYIQFKIIDGEAHSLSEVGVGIFKKSNGVTSLIAEETFYDVVITLGSSNIQASPPTRITQTLVKLKKGERILFGAKLPSKDITVDETDSCFLTIKQVK